MPDVKLPGIPSITPVKDPTIASILRPVKESLEIIATSLYGVPSSSGSTNTPAYNYYENLVGGGGIPEGVFVYDYTPPPAPTGVTIGAAFQNIIIEWDSLPTGYTNHAYTEIWRAEINSFGAASLVGFAPGLLYVDAVGVGKTYYYWIRFVSTSDIKGAYNSSVGTIGSTSLVGNADLSDLIITASKLASMAVTTTKIDDAAITSAKIAALAVGNAAIQNAAITNAKIADLAVDSAKIAALAVGTAKIADASIATAKIQDLAVTTAKIQDAAITNAKIGTAAIGTANIGDASITTAKIADAQITNAKISSISPIDGTTKIADATITTAKIADANITTAKIADANITAAKIADANITTAKIANAAITNAKIGTAEVSTLSIAGNAVTVPVGTYTSSAQYIGAANGGFVQIMSLVINVSVLNIPYIVHFSATIDSSGFSTLQIREGGNIVASFGIGLDYTGYLQIPSNGLYLFPAGYFGSIGNYTISVWANPPQVPGGSGGAYYARGRGMTVTGLKR